MQRSEAARVLIRMSQLYLLLHSLYYPKKSEPGTQSESQRHYGVRGISKKWFSSYLTTRKQFVSIDNCNSTTKAIFVDVPQGSVLGHLLFLTYINDLHKCVKILRRIILQTIQITCSLVNKLSSFQVNKLSLTSMYVLKHDAVIKEVT